MYLGRVGSRFLHVVEPLTSTLLAALASTLLPPTSTNVRVVDLLVVHVMYPRARSKLNLVIF